MSENVTVHKSPSNNGIHDDKIELSAFWRSVKQNPQWPHTIERKLALDVLRNKHIC